MSFTPLPRDFFLRDPREVAPALLGKLLVRPTATALLAGRIVEAEAYLGTSDPGAHAFRGITPRNAVLFGEPGHAYVYFIYGSYFCMNVSCQPAGQAGCVLLRALEPVLGAETMAANRSLDLQALTTTARRRLLTSGPGRLCQALDITRPEHNGCDLCTATSSLYLAADDFPEPLFATTPRINVPSAPFDLWRYILPGNPYISGPRRR